MEVSPVDAWSNIDAMHVAFEQEMFVLNASWPRHDSIEDLLRKKNLTAIYVKLEQNIGLPMKTVIVKLNRLPKTNYNVKNFNTFEQALKKLHN